MRPEYKPDITEFKGEDGRVSVANCPIEIVDGVTYKYCTDPYAWEIHEANNLRWLTGYEYYNLIQDI